MPKQHSPALRASVALAAARADADFAVLAERYAVSRRDVRTWHGALVRDAERLFDGSFERCAHREQELRSRIIKLTAERDLLRDLHAEVCAVVDDTEDPAQEPLAGTG